MRRLPVFVPFLVIVITMSTVACNSREVASIEPDQVVEEKVDIGVETNRNIDFLFVIDNSGSMSGEQDSLALNFPLLMDALDDPLLGLPSVHIAVVTTDVSTAPYVGGRCVDGGDKGDMVASGVGCQGPSGSFIRDIGREDGSRDRNYTGDLSEVFSCIARVGIEGCGFEQSLEAMRLALDNNPNNEGFLRDDALLAIVFITDEDDCSAGDTRIFDRDGAQNSPTSELGVLGSFRCFEFGVECDGASPRVAGVRENCVPKSDSPFLTNVNEFVEFVRSKKPFPDSQIFVAAIAGPTSPVEVLQDEGESILGFSCEGTGLGEAVPPIRLKSFLDSFPGRNTLASICGDDLAAALAQIGGDIDDVSKPCVLGRLADTDPSTPELEPECSVSEVRFPNTDQEVETLLAECNNLGAPDSSSNLPCYTLLAESDCTEYPTGLALEVHYGEGYPVPPGTRAVARCVGE
jgi:hypothetical protein